MAANITMSQHASRVAGQVDMSRIPMQKTGIALAVLCALSMPTMVFAQAADAGAEAATQLVITGSKIRGVAPVGSTIVSVGRSDIEASGAVSTAQMLQEVPQVFNLGVSENSRGQSGGSGNITYGSSVNLRGIGPFATLALVNGHRVVGQGTTAAAVDPSIMPTLALERVEIVADGASAIYGSDAVAGVVNMIMRRNVEGAEAFARVGTADSYKERQAGAIWGHKWNGGQFNMSIQNDYHSNLNGANRDFFTGNLTANGGGDFRSTQCAPGNIVIGSGTYPIPAGGVTKANAASLVAGTANKCDNLKYADLMPQQERNSGTFTFNQEIGNGISVYADGFATRREYALLPTMLASNLTVPSTNPFYVRPPAAAAGTTETVAYSFLNDLPQNKATGFSRSSEVTLGADMALGNDWKAGVLYTYGKNFDQSLTEHGLNNAAITAALANTDPATALNVFGGKNNPATLAAISNTIGISPGEAIFKNYQVKADGPLFALPGGKVRAAVGFERQDYRAEGGQTSGTYAAPVFGSVVLERSVDSFYTELLVPVFGTANAVEGIQKLDLDLAVRQDKYSDVGSTHNPKIGVNWSPVKGFTAHASYGTSFRAPGLTQIRGFSNGGKGGIYVQNYSDPTIGGALRVGVALSGANLDLTPETAKTKSIGFDWEPAIGNRTKLSLNFFDIQYDNQVSGFLSDLTVLNKESQFDGTGIIQRNPPAALVASLLANYTVSGVPPATWTLFVDGRSKNLGKSVSQGFDFAASTRFPTASYGNFGVGVSGTVFTKYTAAITAAAPMIDQLNTIYNPMKFKARFSGTWSYGPWFANAFVNYINGYDNNLTNPVQSVKSYYGIDGRISYDLGANNGSPWLKDATVALGVVNLLDKTPPFVNIAQSNNGGGGFDPTQVNPVGRIVSLSLNKKF